MKYTILEINNTDLKIEFEFNNKEKSIQTISVAPYWINTVDEYGKNYSVLIKPTDNLHDFICSYVNAYEKGKSLISVSIDQQLIGQTIQIN